MFLVCERWVETRTDCYFNPSSSSPIAALLSHLGWDCSTVGHWGPKVLCLPLALNSASCLQLTLAICPLVILLFNIHLLPLFFRLFTEVHLLIDSSVKGQYVTLIIYTYILSSILLNTNNFSIYLINRWYPNGHSAFLKSPELQSYHQMKFSFIPRTPLFVIVILWKEIQWTYSTPHREPRAV